MNSNMQDTPFINVISLMMHGFGDNQIPNIDTVKLVESVVLKILRDLLHVTSKYVEDKGLHRIHGSDIIFQLRHDRHKMQRIVKYLDYKLISSKLTNSLDEEDDVPKGIKNKYQTIKNFIKDIDETGEFLDTDEFDTVKYERQIRAERLSNAMDETEYKNYTKARQASFFSKQFCQPEKFKNWLDSRNYLDLMSCAIIILELIAYNIIGNLVDMSLIIRQNNKRTSNDPLQMLSGSCFNATMFNAPHLPLQNEINLGQPPISVRELREVIRRCDAPQVGYIKFTNKSIQSKRKHFLF